MAKKKVSKEDSGKTFQYSIELTGVILIFIGLIGFGFGLAGELVKKFAMFLVGEWWMLLLILVLLLGFMMLFYRKLPKFFSGKLLGFYIIFVVILVISHLKFVENGATIKTIFQDTLNNYMDRIAGMQKSGSITYSGPSNIIIGGGIIGCFFASLFSLLFDVKGTMIVLTILALFGFILLFNVTLFDLRLGLKKLFKKSTPKEANNEEDEEEHKTIITSVDDLKMIGPREEKPLITEEEFKVKEPIASNNNSYNLPSLNILDDPKKNLKANSVDYIKNTKGTLERVLNDFQINGKVVEIHVGPAVTQYEISITAGTKVSRITNLNKEIALALSAKDVRIEAPIPGKNTIGIEIPNQIISEVRIKEILGNIPRGQENAKILVTLGKDIMGVPQVADISKMPHLLVAGSTGSGKSVCINSFICSILMRYTPDEIKLMLIDPKKVELSNYNGVPHLLCPVLTDPKKASVALQKIVTEMERRYELFAEAEVKNIGSYNELIDKQNFRIGSSEKSKLPFIVVFIDELADLMLVAAKEVEDSINRIAALARAAGIHLIVATQRPSTDVITGTIKANIGARLSFAVASGIDSRTILDQMGAERLVGKGDMLYLPMGENSPKRIQGAYISDEEITKLINYVVSERKAQYDSAMTVADNHTRTSSQETEEYEDPMYNEVVEFTVKTGKVSASLLQRRFRFGYNRAARIIDLLEERGIIGGQNGSKPRDVLVKLEEDK